MERASRVLTSTGFLFGLAVLLTNDFVLKQAYPGLITGKLSDFAGLFIFPMFFAALIPRHTRPIYVATGIAFVWWKSPWSQGAIEIWNAAAPYEIARIVDYWDLLALAALSASYGYLRRLHGASRNPSAGPRSLMLPIAIIAAIAFGATASPTVQRPCEVTPNDPANTFVLDFHQSELAARLDATGLRHSGPNETREDYEVHLPDLGTAHFVALAENETTVIRLTSLDAFIYCDTPRELAQTFDNALLARLRGDSPPYERSLQEGRRLDYEVDKPLLKSAAVPFDEIEEALDRYPAGHWLADGVYTQSLDYGYYALFQVAPTAGGTEFKVIGYINNYRPILEGQNEESESTAEEMEPRFQYFLDYIAGRVTAPATTTP